MIVQFHDTCQAFQRLNSASGRIEFVVALAERLMGDSFTLPGKEWLLPGLAQGLVLRFVYNRAAKDHTCQR